VAIYLHIRVLIGILVGLSLRHLLTGAVQLIQHPGRYKIYWVHLAWVSFIFLYLIHFWWWEFHLEAITAWTFVVYFILILYGLLLYLLSALLFPVDLTDYEGFKDYFYSRRRWFFGSLAAIFVIDIFDTLIKGAAYLHGIGPALTAPVASALGMRVVVTYHSKNYEHHKWNRVARFILRIGELCAVTFGDRVIAVSQCLATDLKQRFPKAAAKIYFIPNGATHINTAKSAAFRSNDVLAKYGLDKNKYIISIGRLVPEKGFHDLCRAFRTGDLDCKLLIVGDADHRDEYSKRLLQQASDRIVFTGFVSHDRLQILLQSASLFVLPSYNEGLSIAALEAVGAGTPILLSDIEPNRDLGFRKENYFTVGDVDDLRRKILQDHELYRVDRDKTLQQYNWDVVAAETARVYSTLQAHGREGKPGSLSLKHRAFNSGFGTLAAIGADRWRGVARRGEGCERPLLRAVGVRPAGQAEEEAHTAEELSVLVVGFFSYFYVKYDRIIEQRFRDPVFTNSAKIYAGPRMVRVGSAFTVREIAAELRHAGYGEKDGESLLGSYHVRSGAIKGHPT